jgi:hypothetical protein
MCILEELINTIKQDFDIAMSIYHPTNNALDYGYSITLSSIDILSLLHPN